MKAQYCVVTNVFVFFWSCSNRSMSDSSDTSAPVAMATTEQANQQVVPEESEVEKVNKENELANQKCKSRDLILD